MEEVIIVEGKNDRQRLREIVQGIDIFCTFGTPSQQTIEILKDTVGDRHVFIFTDHDSSGKRIRAMLRDAFPDSDQLYTKKGYAGVEGTPVEHIVHQMEKNDLHEYLRAPYLSEKNMEMEGLIQQLKHKNNDSDCKNTENR